ncbi:MAG: GNAT family N-acetyltransferase [Pseudomonadota bacterium]
MKPTLRTLNSHEMHLVIDMAAREGWNPGPHDAEAFYAADPQGFLVAESAGRVLGCISAVSYGGTFGFIGLFIVAPDLRGQGVGRFLWDAGMARLAGQVIGLDGVPEQQAYYSRKGFELAWQNLRFEAVAQASSSAPDSHMLALDTADFAALCADDRRVFPAAREEFLRAWTSMPGTQGLAWIKNGQLAGWGLIRPCQRGYKIGPLLADTPGIATALYGGLCQLVPAGSTVYLDVPVPNSAALQLAENHNMQRVFATARMYCGQAPVLEMQRIYGITSFELG